MSAKPQDPAESKSAAGRRARKTSTAETVARAGKAKGVKAPARPAAQAVSAGIPDEAGIEQVIAGLGVEDQAAVRQTLSALADHLGSPAAARLWLVTPSPEFGTTPLSAIAAGKAKLVLAVLESRRGPNPAYA